MAITDESPSILVLRPVHLNQSASNANLNSSSSSASSTNSDDQSIRGPFKGVRKILSKIKTFFTPGRQAAQQNSSSDLRAANNSIHLANESVAQNNDRSFTPLYADHPLSDIAENPYLGDPSGIRVDAPSREHHSTSFIQENTESFIGFLGTVGGGLKNQEPQGYKAGRSIIEEESEEGSEKESFANSVAADRPTEPNNYDHDSDDEFNWNSGGGFFHGV